MLFFAGCSGYSNESLYTDDVRSVYVEMFDNDTFERDLEYDLTDAIAKRIEAETPYKIISDKSRADTVLSGKITGIGVSAITLERETGRPLEHQADQFETINVIIYNQNFFSHRCLSRWLNMASV